MNTQLNIPKISMGTWAIGGWMWGGAQDELLNIQTIQEGIRNGLTSIDTAPIYGQGESEIMVGKAIQAFNRSDLFLMTKFGMRWDIQAGDFAMNSKNNQGASIDIYKYAGADSIRYEIEQSLKRLQTDYIDLYQIHWPETTTPIEETFTTVAKLIDEGLIKYAGVCNYNVAQLAKAQSVCPILSNQVPYSMLNRDIENELVPYCLANGVGILAYSPMERGLLTGKINSATHFNEDDHRANHKLFNSKTINQVQLFLEELEPMAEKHSATLSQIVLAWTAQQPGIMTVLAGARTVEQAIANAKAINVVLEHEELIFINRLISKYFN